MRRFIAPARTVTQSTPRTRIIVVELDDPAFAFRAGQAVFAGLAESSVRRPYSIACSPGQARRTRSLELLVQIDDHAAPDPHLERAAAGTPLSIEGPFGSFTLPSPLPERHLLLIAGGTGIAPLRAMLWDTFEREEAVDISVLYSARAPEEFAYWAELAELAEAGRVRFASTVTRERGPSWQGAFGRIDARAIASMLPSVDTRCVVCGPSGLIASTTTLLRDLGVGADRIQTETYAG